MHVPLMVLVTPLRFKNACYLSIVVIHEIIFLPFCMHMVLWPGPSEISNNLEVKISLSQKELNFKTFSWLTASLIPSQRGKATVSHLPVRPELDLMRIHRCWLLRPYWAPLLTPSSSFSSTCPHLHQRTAPSVSYRFLFLHVWMLVWMMRFLMWNVNFYRLDVLLIHMWVFIIDVVWACL
jgi:hypothetical protein